MSRNIRGAYVAVVGGAGFLGSHLTNYLIEARDCHVLVVDNLVAGRREFVHPKADFEHHDITGSEDHLRKMFEVYQIQYVFNYAAYPYIPISFTRPLHVFNVNAQGAIKVINAAQEAGVAGILQVSSAEIYGDGATHGGICRAVKITEGREFVCSLDAGHAGPHHSGCGLWSSDSSLLSEHTLVRPHSTYGAAKAAVDYYCQCAAKERQTPVIALRQFNCVGERETHPYIIPEIISQLSGFRPKNVCTTCYGSPIDRDYVAHGKCESCGKEGCWDLRPKKMTATIKLGNNSFRDFLYAGDAVRIAVELLERGEFGEVYNLGSESGVKMYDLAEMIGKLVGFKEVIVEEDQARKRPWEIWHLQSDNTKIKQVMQEWLPLLSLEEALTRTIDWYNGNGRKWPWEKR